MHVALYYLKALSQQLTQKAKIADEFYSPQKRNDEVFNANGKRCKSKCSERMFTPFQITKKQKSFKYYQWTDGQTRKLVSY